MNDRSKDRDAKAGQGAGGREDRLRAALRANLQRRKQQARARDQSTDAAADQTGGVKNDNANKDMDDGQTGKGGS